jgi:hypothetical protein
VEDVLRLVAYRNDAEIMQLVEHETRCTRVKAHCLTLVGGA